MKASADHRIVGMQILSVIVQDINAATIPKYSAKFRKAGKFMCGGLCCVKRKKKLDIDKSQYC